VQIFDIVLRVLFGIQNSVLELQRVDTLDSRVLPLESANVTLLLDDPLLVLTE
jgi:hypothetical protein